MYQATIGIAVLLAVAVGSAVLYGRDHRTRRYALDRPGRIASPREFRWVYAWIQLSTIAAGLAAFLTEHPAALALPVPASLFATGLAVALVGFWLFWHSKRKLGAQYSPCFDAYLPTRLVQHGVYAKVRHPIYTANLLVLTGLTLATGSAWLFANGIVLAVYYARSAPREERALLGELPGYAAYLRRTGRFWPSLALPRGRR